MDSAAPFSPAKSGPIATPGSLLIRARLSSEDNDSPLTSDASEVEEGFETPSDPEEDIHDYDLAAAPEVGMFPRSSSMLIKANLTRDDDPDEDTSVEDLEEEDQDEDLYGTARVPTSEYKGELLGGEGIKTSTEILVLPVTKEDVEVESSGQVPDDKPRMERSSQDGDLVVQETEIVEDANLQTTKHILTEHEDAVPDADQDGDLVVQEKEIGEDVNLQRIKEILTEHEDAVPGADQDGDLVVQEKDSDALLDAEEHSDNLVEPDQAAEFSKDNAREQVDCLVSDGPMAPQASSQVAKEMVKALDNSSSGDGSKDVNDVLILDSEEEVMTNEEDEERLMMKADALIALLKAASSSSDDGKISASQDVHRLFTVGHPTGLGSSIPSLKPAPPWPARANNTYIAAESAITAGHDTHRSEEQIKLHEEVELIKVKFLRLVYRLGHSTEDTIPSQVLYRLSLAQGIRSGRQTNRAFNLDILKKKALQLEQDGGKDFDFSCNILVIGKSGVGKSATINSIFGEERSQTNPFKPATFSIKQIVGNVDGVTIRLIDTPGLGASGMDQASTRRILTSIKQYIKRCPPDIVLYVDRMDTLTRDLNDLPLLRTITSTLGPSIWFNAIIALTHAASAPPDGPSGSPLSYEVFVTQRSHAVQHSIRIGAGDMRLMNPIAFVENHPSCTRNNEGQRVLPNGLTWRSQMLMLCYSSKILSEANSLLKFQEASPSNLFGLRFRSPPLPFLLSSLLQARVHPKLPFDQGGDYGDSDMDLDDLSDAAQEEAVDEYDQLPSFKPLKKSQIAKLTKEQRRAYFDEYEYRIKLLRKKQWKEELRRLKEMKTRQKKNQDYCEHADLVDDCEQDNAPATIPVPLPDMVMPPSFDCDSPTYRYRFLEPTSNILARPVLDTHGWDHDCGYDGVSVEENLAVAGRFPAVLSAQVTKDKKEFNIHLESAISAKHGENGSTLAGFDIQAMGKQLAYILRGETKFKTLKRNRTTGGVSITFLGETVATGLKLEDQLCIGKQVSLVASTGAVRAQGDTAYGANLEARIQDKDYPISQALLTLGLSLITVHGNLALGANLQSQVPIGRNSKMAVRVGLNNKMTGQVSVRVSTSEQLQLALMGIIPIAISIIRCLRPGESSAY